VTRIAAAQRGLVTTAQLKAAGLGSTLIADRARTGRLHQVFSGVYRVGVPDPLPLSQELAATLACGPHAYVTGGSAAAVWDIPLAAAVGAVEITVIAGGARSRQGIRVRRRHLDLADLCTRKGIRVTRPARALLDMAAGSRLADLERAIAEAKVRGIVSDAQIRGALGRAPKLPGVGKIRAILDSEHGAQHTRSDFERKLLPMLRAARLPEPQCNVRLAGLEADFLWQDRRLVVETDGWRYHGNRRRRFETDHSKTNALKAAGYEVLRFTWRELEDEPLAVIALVAAKLGR